MSILDPKTLFIVVIALHLVLALTIMLTLRNQWAPSLERLGHAMLAGGMGLFLLAFRDIWPDFLTKIVANTLVSIEFVFMYWAICIYFDKRVTWHWKYLPPLASAVAFWLAADQAQRNIASGVILGTQFVPIMLLLLQRRGFGPEKTPRLMLIVSAAIMTAQFWSRAVTNAWVVWWLPERQTGVATDPITLLIGMCAVLVLTCGMLLLHWQRSETSLRAERDKARRASAEKTRFLAAASHDLRQPMQAVSLYLQALGAERLSTDQRALHAKLTVVTDDLRMLLDSLLNVAQLDAGGVVARMAPVSLDALFQHLDEEFAPSVTQKGLRWKLFWPGREMIVRTDFNLLLTLLRNLVTNAIKYTPQGGILIAGRMRGRRALLQVWDTGIGIAEEHRDRLFDEFFQIDNPSRAHSAGVGLGLSIVKRLATILNCELDYRSVVGRGTVFSVLLPDSEPAGSVPPEPAQELDSKKPHEVSRVILVEDNETIVDALGQWARSAGLDLLTFPTGEEALQVSGISNGDCFLVDYRLGAP
ncbi:MAG: hybrid sensor histidine kinase/response regulator [Sulfuritalea sp.]|nr:hybrid sensor histidine kinase/response regulator [Sulfuritalea sp.]